MDELQKVNYQIAHTHSDERANRRKTYIENIRLKCRSYNRNRFWNWLADNILQITILAGAAVVPFLLNISNVPKLIPTIISAVVAVAAVLANYYKFGQRSHNMFRTYWALEIELDHFDAGAGIYSNLNEEQAFERFVAQVDTILSIDFEIITALEAGQQRLPAHLLTLSKDKIKDNQS